MDSSFIRQRFISETLASINKMNLRDIESSLKKIKAIDPKFNFLLGDNATDVDFEKFEEKHGIKIPEKIKEFFIEFNGFKTITPDLEILSTNQWTKNEDNLIHFATFDNKIKIYFDSNKINSANQWTIMNPKAKYELTLSMSSFWSNKIWHWLRNGKRIWEDEYWIEKK